MSLFTGAMVYAVVLWLVLLTVLPFGNRSPDIAEPGHVESAPERPRMWIKAAVTTALATLIWGVIYWIIDADLVSFRD